MKRDKDDWLDQKITEELLAMADEREKELMEMEELQDIDMPIEKFEDIKREAERRRRKSRRGILRPRTAIIAAALLALLLGVGVVTVGSREYRPEIREYESGDGSTTRIENSDSVFSEYDEEEVCREIEEKLGVIAPRLIYRPGGMELIDYFINTDMGEAVLKYEYNNDELKIYISKDFRDSSINFEVDGAQTGSVVMETSEIELPILEYQDSEGKTYYEASFEFLDTYYLFTGMLKQEEFKKILENINIENI
ncbi:hypothetical protein B5F29_10375 [Lachnoclostridium sp. An196]|uniref:DUF4367 domain-containing protein n=1 Tax=Lachnoclostridium sp. An196 TaxID=1965583 RepID=UPI000B385F55|nr:DUF4367 domain-containing protein [Lachnoclostridium sp. An196]OUP18686.1 hypothetical protein B5F29_10375 [Lachnoclostridium sp. An196]